ncbi:MAG: T9SS type A sorting domain-containing protein [Bacteroidetes bacterium]|nr:T9SS type A sorting domain-containing protein [Bacteroidota bacterium]
MKNLLIFICLVVFNRCANAQTNLVPNPGFENYVVCPVNLGETHKATGWSSYSTSPDFFHQCSTNPYLSPPYVQFGYQVPHNGIGYIGLATYHNNTSVITNNYREFCGAQLLSPLQIGTTYYLSFYTVATEFGTGYLTNNLGIRLFTNPYSIANPAPIDNFAHLKFDTIVTDSINWQRLSGSFIADSAYQYICLGNFYDSLHTDTVVFGFPNAGYYFIDDICVTTDSLYNETWTGIQDNDIGEVNIWPNPSQDFLNYKAHRKIEEIRIYDCIGKLVMHETVNSSEGRIDLEGLSNGIYFATFINGRNSSIYKCIKIRE